MPEGHSGSPGHHTSSRPQATQPSSLVPSLLPSLLTQHSLTISRPPRGSLLVICPLPPLLLSPLPPPEPGMELTLVSLHPAPPALRRVCPWEAVIPLLARSPPCLGHMPFCHPVATPSSGEDTVMSSCRATARPLRHDPKLRGKPCPGLAGHCPVYSDWFRDGHVTQDRPMGLSSKLLSDLSENCSAFIGASSSIHKVHLNLNKAKPEERQS